MVVQKTNKTMKLLPPILALTLLVGTAQAVNPSAPVMNREYIPEGQIYVHAVYSVPELRGEVREVSAYTLGNPAETDDTPCVGASNKNLCDLAKQGIQICASNEFPFGTKLQLVDNQLTIECTVEDRMNKRYTTQVDVAMLDRSEALAFGRKNLEVKLVR